MQMDGWMDLLVGAGVSTALRIVQWSKPFHTLAQPLRLGWLFQKKPWLLHPESQWKS